MQEQQVIEELQRTYDYAKGYSDRIREGIDGATKDEPEQVRCEDIAYYKGMMNGVGILARHLGLLDELEQIREAPQCARDILRGS